jgi:hypothetical protein
MRPDRGTAGFKHAFEIGRVRKSACGKTIKLGRKATAQPRFCNASARKMPGRSAAFQFQ